MPGRILNEEWDYFQRSAHGKGFQAKCNFCSEFVSGKLSIKKYRQKVDKNKKKNKKNVEKKKPTKTKKRQKNRQKMKKKSRQKSTKKSRQTKIFIVWGLRLVNAPSYFYFPLQSVFPDFPHSAGGRSQCHPHKDRCEPCWIKRPGPDTLSQR